MNDSVSRMRGICYEMGQQSEDKIPYGDLMKKLAKVIVQEKVMDEEAFEIASKAFAEGFQGLKLGELGNDTNIDNVVSS